MELLLVIAKWMQNVVIAVVVVRDNGRNDVKEDGDGGGGEGRGSVGVGGGGIWVWGGMVR